MSDSLAEANWKHKNKRNSIFNYCFRKFFFLHLKSSPVAGHIWLWRPLHVLFRCCLESFFFLEFWCATGKKMISRVRLLHYECNFYALKIPQFAMKFVINFIKGIADKKTCLALLFIHEILFYFQQSHQRPAIAMLCKIARADSPLSSSSLPILNMHKMCFKDDTYLMCPQIIQIIQSGIAVRDA